MAIGRPSSFTPELGDTICLRISQGESLREVCRSEDMPDKTTINRWLLNQDKLFDNFRIQYAQAREALLEHWAEEIVEISDDGTNDWTMRQGRPVVDNEAVQRSRLRVDTRKWLLSKLAPKKYGDKITQEHQGEINLVAVIKDG